MITFLILFASTSFVAGEVELQLKPLGDYSIKPLGNSIVFTCEVTGDVRDGISYDLKWFNKANQEITERTGRLYVEEEKPTMRKLYITNIEQKDKGQYKCTATVDGQTLEKSVNLDLYKDITFDHAPSPQHPAIFTDSVIKCRVSGSPAPTVSWRYKGERISSGGRYKYETDGISVRNITRDDDGEYICRAEVEADGRYNERKISVIVHIPPKITKGLGQLEGIEGEEITISCTASGLPDPKFEFFKEGNLAPVQSTSRIQVDTDSGSVTFRPLNKSDEGNYVCRAINDVDSDQTVGHLKVLVMPSVYHFNSIVLTEGQALTWDCLSYGDPSPHMTFRKAGQPTDYSLGENEDGRVVVRNSSGKLQLVINGVVPEDMSNYTCKALTSIGVSEQTASITVRFRPRFPANHTRNVYIWAGKTRNITCHVQSYPNPSFEWLHAGRPLANNETYRMINNGKESYLQVKVRDSDQGWIYGNYSCRASNELGTNEIAIDLRRATVPSEPQSIKVAELMPNSIVIDIIPPEENGGEELVGYRVEYGEVKQDYPNVNISDSKNPTYSSNHATLDVQGSRITIDNLKPSTSYVLKVRAKNDVGVGSHLEQRIKTENVRRPYPLRIQSPSVGEAFDYTVEWEKPHTGGVPIEEYEFKFRRVQMNEENGKVEEIGDWQIRRVKDNPNQPMVSYVLDELMPNSTYQLEIRTRNSHGWSNDGKQFIFATRKPKPDEMRSHASASLGVVIGVVVIISVLILVAIDLSCYFINGCGVTMTICVFLCGKKKQYGNEKTLEEGERQKLKDSIPDGKNDTADDNKEEITLQEKEKLMDRKN